VKNSNLSENVIKNELDRNIVKEIFMPMIYGKTLISTIDDLKKIFKFSTQKEVIEVAKLCFRFWKERYPSMENLIVLIRSIGWFASYMNKSVVYSNPYFTTTHDYMKMEKIKIWIYDKKKKKRSQITLRLASDIRDRRKTEMATFVNFIHQKDAQIAMNVVNSMKSLDKKTPFYIVHDNFISTTQYCSNISLIYSKIFQNLNEPLSIINEFIYMNLYKHINDLNINGFNEKK